VYEALGLKVGVIAPRVRRAVRRDVSIDPPRTNPDERLNHWRPVPRHEAYQPTSPTDQQRVRFRLSARQHGGGNQTRRSTPADYAIVDEVDNILVDEARTR